MRSHSAQQGVDVSLPRGIYLCGMPRRARAEATGRMGPSAAAISYQGVLVDAPLPTEAMSSTRGIGAASASASCAISPGESGPSGLEFVLVDVSVGP